MLLGTVRRLTPRSISSGLALVLITTSSAAAMAQSSSRPPAGQSTSTPPAIPSAGAATAGARAPAPRPSAGAATAGASASRPSMSSGSGGGYNPGANSGGSGYNPGGNSGGYNPGGAWNGVTGNGWNPGNYYQQSIIQGWMRLGSATAGKNAERDTIQAYGRYRYSRIKLCVRGADVAFYKAQVQFEYSGRQDVSVQSRVRRGQCTREYYLRGGKSLDIRYVYLYFRQADNVLNWRSAQVDLYAR